MHRAGYRLRLWAWLRHQHIALRTLFGSTVGDQLIADYICNRRELAGFLASFESQIPQAQVLDNSVTCYEQVEWRRHFGSRLDGRGLELGPLHRPLSVKDGVHMTYLDRADRDSLSREYPDLARGISRVDVIDDAEVLGRVADGAFDFLVAAHVLEHMRNPIRALENWLRVVRPEGVVYIIVPDKRRTFDRFRVRTTLEHLILDYRLPSRDRDFEHFLDYAVHVHRATGDAALNEAERLERIGFSIHFHTFIPRDAVTLVGWISDHVHPLRLLEGPVMSPESDEFHLLLQKLPSA